MSENRVVPAQPIVRSSPWIVAVFGAAAFVAAIAIWAYFGPMAGALWSLSCVFFGVMLEAIVEWRRLRAAPPEGRGQS